MSALDEIASRIRWQDAVDIAILTFLGFRVYLWVRGTVALQLLSAVAGILLAALIARRGGLILTAYVIQALGAVATLVLVVVFQDEIRRGLRRFNPALWWRRRREHDGDRGPLRRLCDGAFQLAEKRVGALLVLPGDEPIDELISGGMRIDAALNAAMLEAVFQVRSPIHDGAAIIRNGRIDRAGVVLPLSTSANLPVQLGTRHRAAAGLTQECDAVVLVVSEERGEVSIARGGRVERAPEDGAALADRLVELAAQPIASVSPRAATSADGKRGKKRHRLRDLAALAIILVGVFGAWYTVVGEAATEVTTEVPVEMRNVPEGYTVRVVHPTSGRVQVRVRGPRQLLTDAVDEVTAWVELGDVHPGRQRLKIRTGSPRIVNVAEVIPSHVVLRIVPQTDEP